MLWLKIKHWLFPELMQLHQENMVLREGCELLWEKLRSDEDVDYDWLKNLESRLKAIETARVI